MKKLILLLFAIATLGLGTADAQVTIEGVTLPATLDVAGTSLTLNGGGLREKMWFDLYVGGLYVGSKTSDGNAVVNDDAPMTVRLVIISKLISSEKMSEATMEGFEKSMGGNISPLKSEIDNFIDVFKKDEIVLNDQFDLKYIPGTGVKVSKNGKDLTTVAGLEFKKALFGIWFGNDPVDKDLKAGMLGK